MPQIDHLSFITQIFWLVLIFVSLYFVTLRYILPAISAVVKIRKAKLGKLNNQMAEYEKEEVDIQTHYQETIGDSLKYGQQSLVYLVSSSNAWINESLLQENKNQYDLNYNYVKTLADISATQYVVNDYIINPSATK